MKKRVRLILKTVLSALFGLCLFAVFWILVVGLLLGFAYAWDSVFYQGGPFRDALNKILIAIFTLLPGLISYAIVRELIKQSKDFASLSRAKKLFVILKHIAVMMAACAVIAYAPERICDDSGWCDFDDSTEREANIVRLAMICLLGMLFAYDKRDPFVSP